MAAGKQLLLILLIAEQVQAARQIGYRLKGVIAEIRGTVAPSPHGRGKLPLHPHPGDLLHIPYKPPVRQGFHRALHGRIPEFLHRFQLLRRFPIDSSQHAGKTFPVFPSVGIAGIVPKRLRERPALLGPFFHRFLFCPIDRCIFPFHAFPRFPINRRIPFPFFPRRATTAGRLKRSA